METINLWLFLGILCAVQSLLTNGAVVPPVNGTARNTDNDSSSSEDELLHGGYVLPKQIFNEGKPFYLDKDPVSGQLDFSSKKPAGIEPAFNEVIDPIEKNIVLNTISPNFHDFLNLPVKYTSSKFVYPLVSSSYANLKYQGSNKNFISNHKNISTTTTTSPKYYTLHRETVSKVEATLPKTTPVPITTSIRPFKISTPNTNKLVTKPKFSPTKKVFPSSTTPSNIVKFPQEIPSTVATTVTVTRTTATPTTVRPVTVPVSTTTVTTTTSTTAKPATTTQIPLTTASPMTPTTPVPSTTTVGLQTTREPAFRPLPTTTATYATMDSADVYSGVGQKKEPNVMTLADIFNSLNEEDSEYGKYGSEMMEPLTTAVPSPFSTQSSLVGFNKPIFPEPNETNERNPQTSQTNYANDYVRYEVQQPNLNVMQYHPVSSMNNIVISPEQNSASFVVGSQQSVGTGNYDGSSEQAVNFSNGHRIQYGTVINEDISHLNVAPNSPLPNQSGQVQSQPNQGVGQQTQELYVSSNIRFPSDNSDSGSQPVEVYQGTPIGGDSLPVALSHIQNNPFVFPKNDFTEGVQPQDNNNNKVVFTDIVKPDGSPKQEILTLNQQQLQNKMNYPQLPNGLTPPLRSEPVRYASGEQNQHLNPHRPRLPPPGFLYNEFARKPVQGLHPPNPDRPLPNILPQFRPNAKISNGHPSYGKEPGNMRFGHPGGPFPNRSPIPPPFAHRHTPIGNRYNLKMLPPQQKEAHRRVYKLPPPHFPHLVDRVYMQQPHQPQLLNQMPPQPQLLNQMPPQPQVHLMNQLPPQRFVDNYSMERHTAHMNPLEVSELEVKPERLAAFKEQDYLVSDTAAVQSNDDKDSAAPKLEPVVTLQMLKTQKKVDSAHLESGVPAASQKLASVQPPVYVVYPVKSSPLQMDITAPDQQDEQSGVVIGQRGDQPPVPPAEINSMAANSDYQNTPFSVVRDQPQEPILMVKNKQQHQNKPNFPYPLEKPDPAFAEFSKQREQERFENGAAMNLSPRVVNRGNAYNDLNRNTDTPIAIAYTPTEPNPYHGGQYNVDHRYSVPNLASPVIPEIRDTQTEATFMEETDIRGQNFEKDFMAPFYPSMSLSGVPNTHTGWAVLPPVSDRPVYEKNSINRADIRASESGDQMTPIEATTKKFDPEHFQPEFESGFRPIYPPNYKIESQEQSERPTLVTTPVPKITTTEKIDEDKRTKEQEKHKKSPLEASIESLLFGDDDDDFNDDNDENKTESSS